MRKLPKPRFNLKDPKASSETLISLIFRYRGRLLKHSTKDFIHPKDWDQKLQKPVLAEGRDELMQLDERLALMSKTCLDIYIEYEYGALKVDDFKFQIEHRLDNLKNPVQQGFHENDDDDRKETGRIEFLDFIDIELAE